MLEVAVLGKVVLQVVDMTTVHVDISDIVQQKYLLYIRCTRTPKDPCAHCGEFNVIEREILRTKNLQVCGIDRVDPLKGYISGNMKAVCSVCNRMKLDHSEEFFLKQCEKIVNYTKKNNTFPINDLEEIWRIYA